MAETESVRVEIGFDGGQILSALVTLDSAESLERALGSGTQGPIALDAHDGRYSVVTERIVYMKRFARESRVGFGI